MPMTDHSRIISAAGPITVWRPIGNQHWQPHSFATMLDAARAGIGPHDTLTQHIDLADIIKEPKTVKGTAAIVRGKLGGKARAEALSPERRSQIAKKAAKARWRKP